MKHAKLLFAIKLENGTDVPEDINELNLDEDGLDIETLEHEIRNYWIEREFAD